LLKNKERARKTAKVNSLQQNKALSTPAAAAEKFCKAETRTPRKNAVFFIKSSLTA